MRSIAEQCYSINTRNEPTWQEFNTNVWSLIQSCNLRISQGFFSMMYQLAFTIKVGSWKKLSIIDKKY